MNKKYAFISAFLILLLILLNFISITTFSIRQEERENVIISRIIDGDTIELQDGRTIRLLNINSPEKGTIGATLSAEFLRQFENKTIELEITGADKYKRILARIYAPEYINLELVKQGLASKFLVDESELSDFLRAEENAIRNNLGIWKKSSFSNCFDSKIGKYNEIVTLTSKCQSLNMDGFYLKDESRKTYTFKSITFSALTLHSTLGDDNLTDIFWQSKTDIWNNDRDTLYLFDSNGGIAHHETYGY